MIGVVSIFSNRLRKVNTFGVWVDDFDGFCVIVQGKDCGNERYFEFVC